VDNSELILRVYRNGALEREMPTSMGKDGFRTPSGTYLVMQQDRRYTMDSSTYGTPIDDPEGYRTEVEYASRISYSGIFVHAAPWSVQDQGVRNVSHGCLNVSTSNAGYFYENFGWGDIVQVTGTGVALEPTDGLGDWNIPWEQWILGSALS
jgi:lipoprotein-anchoring transpeptidase ErfK/SrfK